MGVSGTSSAFLPVEGVAEWCWIGVGNESLRFLRRGDVPGVESDEMIGCRYSPRIGKGVEDAGESGRVRRLLIGVRR